MLWASLWAFSHCEEVGLLPVRGKPERMAWVELEVCQGKRALATKARTSVAPEVLSSVFYSWAHFLSSM